MSTALSEMTVHECSKHPSCWCILFFSHEFPTGEAVVISVVIGLFLIPVSEKLSGPQLLSKFMK